MSDPNFVSRCGYLTLEEAEWRELHRFAAGVAGLHPILDAIQARAEEQFAMAVWSVEDIYNAAAQARGRDIDPGDPATFAESGLSQADVGELLRRLHSVIGDYICVVGWEVLEDLVAEYMREHGLITA
jgi:hypothetical protein